MILMLELRCHESCVAACCLQERRGYLFGTWISSDRKPSLQCTAISLHRDSGSLSGSSRIRLGSNTLRLQLLRTKGSVEAGLFRLKGKLAESVVQTGRTRKGSVAGPW